VHVAATWSQGLSDHPGTLEVAGSWTEKLLAEPAWHGTPHASDAKQYARVQVS
jgi:hypothetical protein